MKRDFVENLDDKILCKVKILKDTESDFETYIEFKREEEINKLKLIKEELIETMTQLESVSKYNWRKHTKITCFAEGIANYAKKSYNAELSTRAWAKCYEILSKYWVFFENSFPTNENGVKIIRTLHLCEGPGAFISALNHFLYSNYELDKYKWYWFASSLNPYYEFNEVNQLITDDILIKKTSEKWIFGKHYSGNICDPENFESIVLELSKLGKFSLISADGGIDCSDEPEQQEFKTSLICQCEVFAGLSVLETSGCLFIKIYTLFETITQNLLLFLCSFFSTVELFKPNTSGHGNSEIYVICTDCLFTIEYRFNVCQRIMNYTGQDPLKLENLFLVLSNEIRFSNLILKRIFDSARYFSLFQIQCIEENLAIFPKIPNKTLILLKNNQIKYSKKFFADIKINPLPEIYSLHLSEWCGRSPWYYAPHNFKDCQYGKSLNQDNKFSKYMQWFMKYSFDNQNKICNFLTPLVLTNNFEANNFTFELIFCKKYTQINYSKLIRNKNLMLLNFARSQRWESHIPETELPIGKNCCQYCSDHLIDIDNNSKILNLFSNIHVELLQLSHSQIPINDSYRIKMTSCAINCGSSFSQTDVSTICQQIWHKSSTLILDIQDLNSRDEFENKFDVFIAFFSICFRKNSFFENSHRSQLLKIIAFTLEHINPNGELILPIGDTFSFFTLNVIILLSSVFEKTIITKMRSFKYSPSLTMINCIGFRYPSDSFLKSFKEIASIVETNHDKNSFIHHFLRIDYSIEEVASKLYEFNLRVTKPLAIVTYSDFPIDSYF